MARALGRSLDDFKSLFIDRKLLSAEEKLLSSCAKGEVAEISPGTRPDKCTEANRVRAGFLRFLMLGGDEEAPVHEQGMRLKGAWVEGPIDTEGAILNLEGAILPHDIELKNCVIAGKIALIAARTRRIDLDGSRIGELSGDGVEIKGDLFLRNGFMAEGDVKLTGATIGGDLDCSGGVFKKKADGLCALCFNRAKIDGNVFLKDKFLAEEQVLLIGAKIAGDLDCRGGVFRNRETNAKPETSVALGFDRVTIGGAVFLKDRFRARGVVRFVGAEIVGDLDLCKCWFVNPNGVALNFDGAKIDGEARLANGFRAKGEVRLENAKIKGHLRCSNGKFQKRPNAEGYAHALYFDGVEIGAGVWLDEGFSATGVVRLHGAKIAGDLKCEGGSFIGAPREELVNKKENRSKIALSMNYARVDGRFYLRNLKNVSSGDISLKHTYVGVLVDDTKPLGKYQCEQHKNCYSYFYLDGFTYGRIHSEAPTSWHTRLDWLKSQIPEHLGKQPRTVQPQKHFKVEFKPQPWEQLIKVLREMGHDDEAKQIAIAKQKHLCEVWERKKRRVLAFSHWLLGVLMDYGYRPGKLAKWMVGMWLVSGILYYWAASEALFGPSNPLVFNNPELAHCAPDRPRDTVLKKPKIGNWWLCPELPGEYTSFSPFVYSADLILPVVSFGQAKDWGPITPSIDPGNGTRSIFKSMFLDFLAILPDVFGLRIDHLPTNPTEWRDCMAFFVRFWTWIENLFGWASSLLMVATLSGLVKKDEA